MTGKKALFTMIFFLDEARILKKNESKVIVIHPDPSKRFLRSSPRRTHERHVFAFNATRAGHRALRGHSRFPVLLKPANLIALALSLPAEGSTLISPATRRIDA